MPDKKEWENSFLVNPDEGYDYCWLGRLKTANPTKDNWRNIINTNKSLKRSRSKSNLRTKMPKKSSTKV